MVNYVYNVHTANMDMSVNWKACFRSIVIVQRALSFSLHFNFFCIPMLPQAHKIHIYHNQMPANKIAPKHELKIILTILQQSFLA